MRSTACRLLAFPARFGVCAALFAALAAAATELAPPAEGSESAGSRPSLPRSMHDLALFEDGRYAVIRFPRQLAFGETGGGTPQAASSPPGGLPQSLAGPTPDGRILVGDSEGVVWSQAPVGPGVRWNPLVRHGGPADLLCLCPNGRRVAVASGAADHSAERGSPVTVCDSDTGTVRARFVASGPLDWLGFCADSERLLTRAEDETLSVWQARDGGHLATIRCGAAGRGSAACSPAGPLFAWCGPAGDGTRRICVRVLNLSGGGFVWERMIELDNDAALSYVPRLAFSGDGLLLACGTADAVMLFDASDGRGLAEADAAWHRAAALRFAADGRSIVSAGGDGTVRWWGVPDLVEQLCIEDLLPD